MWADLRYLISTFPPRERRLLIVNGLAQFLLATLDLLGVAAILPLMNVLMGSSLDKGMLGHLHSLFGNQPKEHFVLTLGALMVAAFVLKTVLGLLLTRWSAGHVARLQTRTARNLLQTFMSETYLEHRRRNTGELIRIVGTAVTDAHTKVLGGVMSAASSLMSIGLIVALLLFVTPLVTVVATIYFAVVVFAIQRILGPRNGRAGAEAQHTSWVSSHALVDAMQGFREARLHNARGYFVDKFDSANVRTARASMLANYYAAMPKFLLEAVTMVGLTAFIVMTIFTGSAASAMPTMSLFVGATIKILPLMVALTATIGFIRYGREGLAITVESLRFSEQAKTGDLHDMVPPKDDEPSADIVIDDVSFRYPDGSQNVLTGINLTVPAGTSLALCGASGSGKTTLVDIILGLMPPSHGEVTYAGIPTTDAGDGWHNIVAYVPQDVYISDSTLAGNVAFGLPEDLHDRDFVHDCLRRAALSELVETLPEGINTLVGERGNRLSGGQRQRIGIARALYRRPRVLVLDEATSALDNETEHRITQTLASIRGDITTIVVAHRLSTVRDVDNLAFLHHGRLAAAGTFAEVIERSEDFARLVELGRLDSNAPKDQE